MDGDRLLVHIGGRRRGLRDVRLVRIDVGVMHRGGAGGCGAGRGGVGIGIGVVGGRSARKRVCSRRATVGETSQVKHHVEQGEPAVHDGWRRGLTVRKDPVVRLQATVTQTRRVIEGLADAHDVGDVVHGQSVDVRRERGVRGRRGHQDA